MGWAGVQKWIEESCLPFRYSIYATSEDLLFPETYTHFFDYLVRVARQCIVFDNLPDTFYEPFFTFTLFVNGKICVFRRDNGELVALNCAQASKPDLYYVPSKVLVVNPQFKGESYNLTPGEDCEMIYCTSQDMYRYGIETGGLYSLLSITARLLADNYVSLNCAQRNTRLTTALAADDEITKGSIETVLREMYAGRPFKVVQKTLLDKLESFPLQDTGTQQNLIQLLETHKYILSEFYAAIGIDEAQQMKRERLVTAEVTQGAELPMFNLQDMISSISDGVERVNKMFGTEISVRINPLIVQALEADTGTDEPEPEKPKEEASLSDKVIQPDPERNDTQDKAEEEPDGTTGSESPDMEPEPAAPEEPEEPEAEIVSDAVEIIEAAAEIIDKVTGGDSDDSADVPGESGDQSGAGEIRQDLNS